MATKCITVTTKAYDRLLSHKQGKESFSDVITKLTRKSNLMKLAGILSPKQGEELKKLVKESRKRLRSEVDKRTARIL
tara:strand:- start:207 stop:440 length:234 start_codon:yes stop_codon:yes gene_type:complete